MLDMIEKHYKLIVIIIIITIIIVKTSYAFR